MGHSKNIDRSDEVQNPFSGRNGLVECEDGEYQKGNCPTPKCGCQTSNYINISQFAQIGHFRSIFGESTVRLTWRGNC